MEKLRSTLNISTREFLSHALPWCVENNFSYALWKLPSSPIIHFAASERPQQLTEVNLDEALPGFLFAPFHPAQKKVHLPSDEYFTFESEQIRSSKGMRLEEALAKKDTGKKIDNLKPYYSSLQTDLHSEDTEKFLRLVKKCIDEIGQGTFEKIVPSRSKAITLPDNFDLAGTFHQLIQLYPQAMVSVFSSPLSGTWIGATPEMLVSVDKAQHFHTVAVAGTQSYIDGTDLRSVSWTQKDIEEQALVERYVISCFKKIRLREFEEHGPRTFIAGNVLHLRTDFSVDMTATNFPQLGTIMLKLLHPTSAVCGMPMEASLAFLHDHEGYDRQFYSGYLGPVNVDQESHLYVNLRCVQLFKNAAVLYAGAGVLADSDPEKEWNETEMKMNTIGRVIRQ